MSGENPVPRDPLVLHAEIVAAVHDESVQLLAGAGVEQGFDALAGRQLPGLVLLSILLWFLRADPGPLRAAVGDLAPVLPPGPASVTGIVSPAPVSHRPGPESPCAG